MFSLMKWEMEIEEIETVLEKIWDLHDKLSDAIHSISRAHFLSSVKSLRNSGHRKSAVSDEERVSGYVHVKDFRLDSGDDDDCAIQEAKSLNAIRTALESLEDHLEIFHVSFSFLALSILRLGLLRVFLLYFALLIVVVDREMFYFILFTGSNVHMW